MHERLGVELWKSRLHGAVQAKRVDSGIFKTGVQIPALVSGSCGKWSSSRTVSKPVPCFQQDADYSMALGGLGRAGEGTGAHRCRLRG